MANIARVQEHKNKSTKQAFLSVLLLIPGDGVLEQALEPVCALPVDNSEKLDSLAGIVLAWKLLWDVCALMKDIQEEAVVTKPRLNSCI